MTFDQSTSFKAVAFILCWASALSAVTENEGSKWGEIKAEKLVWNGDGGLADDVEVTAGTLFLNVKKIDLQQLDFPQKRYHLACSGGIELISEPSALHDSLPMGSKARWIFHTPQASIEWNQNRRWQSVELFSKVSLKAQILDDQVSGDAESRSFLTALRFYADHVLFTRPWQVLIDRWKVWGRLHPSSSLGEFTCSADQLTKDDLTQQIHITPHTTMQLPWGEIEHHGPLTLSSIAVDERSKALKWGECRLRGDGATTGKLTRPTLMQSIEFKWPLGFEYDTHQGQLRFFGQGENQTTLTATEKGRSLQLFAEKGDLRKVSQKDTQDQLRAQFFDHVQLICRDEKSAPLITEGQEHQIQADRLICYWPKRQLIFNASQNSLVRYSNTSKNLNISAPYLKIDCPSNSPFRVHGQGTVRAKIEVPQKLLIPLTPPLTYGQ